MQNFVNYYIAFRFKIIIKKYVLFKTNRVKSILLITFSILSLLYVKKKRNLKIDCNFKISSVIYVIHIGKK